jgi:hypothetical protein
MRGARTFRAALTAVDCPADPLPKHPKYTPGTARKQTEKSLLPTWLGLAVACAVVASPTQSVSGPRSLWRPDVPVVSGAAVPPAVPAARPDFACLLAAIRQVESGGRANPPDGDRGRAIGPYQIHRVYWIDARLAGRYEDCRREPYARRVVLAWWRRHEPAALAAGDLETLARAHSGGPDWRAKPATAAYWGRVEAAMKGA